MEVNVIDDLLSEDELNEVKTLILGKTFPWYILEHVATTNEVSENWNWYGCHVFYVNDEPISSYYKKISEIFLPKFHNMIQGGVRSLKRIKANFYPWTETLQEHALHSDYHYDIKTIIFSLNTCDGYTKFENGTKFNSVENKALFFNGKDKHLSTTTTSCKGRYNIVFNFF